MTERDMAEINVIWGDKEKPIDWRRKFFASEMWAIDYFKERGIINYDETGYFTSLVVMVTLMMNNGKWYQWREQDYNKLP